MESEIDQAAKDLPDKAPKLCAKTDPPEATHDATNSEKECQAPRECGDCEPDGFGRIFGFSPR
jgi:hypothetical protein